jgi:hypothetical protein
VHPVEAPQERAFAAAGRPDERRDRALWDGQVYLLERVPLAVIEIQAAHLGL